MALTGADIQAALLAAGAGGGLVMSTSDIADAFNEAMAGYGDGQFNTADRVAALVSECMMESAYFRTTEEYAKHGRYAPYIGRTFIQITWKDNYAKFGKWAKSEGLVPDADYFVDNPSRLADRKWAAIGGVWYFTKVLFAGKPLTAYSGNIGQVGKAVNLGSPFSKNTPNGQRAREAAYHAVRKQGSSIVPALKPSTPAAPVADVPPSNKGLPLMVSAKDYYSACATDQVVEAGWRDLKIKDPVTDPKTKKVSNTYTISSLSEAVDIVATVEIAGLKLGEQAKLRAIWYDDIPGGERAVQSVRVPVSVHGAAAGDVAGQVNIKGAVAAPKTKGHVNLLRLQVWAPHTITVKTVQLSGWAL